MRTCCVWLGGACWLRQVSCRLPPRTSFPGASQEFPRSLVRASHELPRCIIVLVYVCMCVVCVYAHLFVFISLVLFVSLPICQAFLFGFSSFVFGFFF